MPRPIVCLVTDGALRRGDDPAPLLQRIRAAAHAGANLVQIRERDLDDRSLLALARRAVQTVSGTPAAVVVNDRPDVALAAGAAGVHLRADAIAASEVRRLVPSGFLVGRSVHGEREAVAAAEDGGCDYLIFGTVFPSASKPDGQPAGLDALRRVTAAVTLPIVAIGGISADRAAEVAAAGAAGVAGIGWFARSTALTEEVARVRRAFDT